MFLSHHGIQGQKWGQRNGPPYPLSYEKYSEKEQDLNQPGITRGKDGVIRINKGTKIQRISKYDESNKKGHSYVTYLENDNARYTGMFGMKLKGGFFPPAMKAYKVEYETKEDLISPGRKERKSVFEQLYRNDPKFREELDKYSKEQASKKDKGGVNDFSNLTKKQLNNQGYFMFSRSLGGSDYIREQYFSALKDRGYNFVQDDEDTISKFGREPAIIFDTEKSLTYKGQNWITTYEAASTLIKNGSQVKE